MIRRACVVCGQVFDGRGARCYGCEPRAAGTRRATEAARGYDAAYRKARLLVLGGPCTLALPGCTGIATTADHVVPVVHGGAHGALRGACAHCNSARGSRGGGRCTGNGRSTRNPRPVQYAYNPGKAR